MSTSFFSTTFLLLVGCGGEEPKAPEAPAEAVKTNEAAPAPAGATYGDSFDAKDPTPVSTLTKEAEAWNGKEVVASGTIRAVCQKKGCWHTLSTDDPNTDVMVKASRYHIFLPKDASGRTAVVKGTFSKAVMPLDEARHYAEDAGKDPNTVTEAPVTYSIDAAGVVLL